MVNSAMALDTSACTIRVLSFFVLVNLVSETGGHVSLTYPPARKYALDFLDNLRTTGPCGIPKGLGPTTSLVPGSRINVTWNIAYPHRGGYQLNLLNASEEPIYNLTLGDGFIGSSDPTRRYQEVTLPTEECRNCSIQLVRQAGEWSAGSCGQYLFWSCADVNIANGASALELCNGFPMENGACVCGKPYSGTRCQYKDDCQSDDDCSGRGVCSASEGFYHRMHCFCDVGFFGKTCERESSIKSFSLDVMKYTHTDLSPRFQLLHRILYREQEVEVVLKVKTETWVGIGWRPSSFRSGCQHFPPLPGTSLGSTDSTSEPEVTSEPETTAKPVSCTGSAKSCADASCPYEVSWIQDPKNDDVSFTVSAQVQSTEWLALGFSPDKSMPNTDVYLGWVDASQNVVIKDRFATQKSEPTIDAVQNIYNTSGSFVNGRTTLKFTRKRNTGDQSDFPLTDGSCWYFMMAWGGTYNPNDGSASYHKHRVASSDKICISTCETKENEGSTANPETTAEPVSCTGSVKSCADASCPYEVSWIQDPKNDDVSFTVSAQVQSTEWLALGFSPDKSMPNTDVYLGWVDASQSVVIKDRFATRKQEPTIDTAQNIYNISGSFINGRTTIRFTRKRNTGDQSDFPLTDGSCWYFMMAWGGTYNPNDGSASYHKHRVVSNDKICISTCDTIENAGSTAEPETTAEPVSCTGSAKSCADASCPYEVSWIQDPSNDDVTFTVSAQVQSTEWLALGFSPDQSMPNTDVYLGWVDASQNVVIKDRFASQKSEPTIDAVQNIYNTSGSFVNGRTTLKFTRKRNTGDQSDFPLTDGSCWYFMMAWGGTYNPNDGSASYHQHRVASSDKICISTCGTKENPGSIAEPESTAEPESSAEPEPSGTCGRGVFAGTSDTTGNTPHPMDCTDMVIGAARGMRSWVGDYYTRGRSTPQRDEFYGGSESLTAAAGFEKDGYTYILFRRKLKVSERTDHEISDNYMNLIWAQGQDAGSYVHTPAAGVDVEANISDKNFYKPDDLKYHGPREHRGTRTFNFFDGNKENTAAPNLCNNQWGRCLDNSDVNCFLVTWIYDTNQITFTVKAYVERNQWVGIGFNENPRMAGTDVIVGWRTENGEAVIQDRKATAYAEPPLDSQQDATLISSSRVDSITTLNFSRPLITNDKDDVSLSYNCVHFIYAKGGTYTSSNSITYHDNTPIISSKKICIPCTGVEEPSTTSTEVPASQRTNVRSEFKITNTPWDSKLGDATSQEFRTLADKLRQGLLSLLRTIPGFVDVKILRFRQGSVIVEFDVIMAGDEGAVAQGSTAALEKLRTEGQLAEFTVDKDSVKLVPAEASDEKSALTVPLIIIIAISAAGVLLVLVLGTCNCIRNRQQTEKQDAPNDYVHLNITGNRNTDSMKLSYEEWSKQQQEYINPTFDNAPYTGLGSQSSDNLVSKDDSGTKEQGTFIRHFCE